MGGVLLSGEITSNINMTRWGPELRPPALNSNLTIPDRGISDASGWYLWSLECTGVGVAELIASLLKVILNQIYNDPTKYHDVHSHPARR